jgi:hypothetical protein
MYSKCSLKLNKKCCRTGMATLEKRRGRPRDRSRFILKQTFAQRASDFKSFEDLPEHLQLKAAGAVRGRSAYGHDASGSQ